MRCEVCGDEIRGQPHRRIIEGGRMTVCGRCASFGTSEWSPSMPRERPRGRPAPRRPRSEVEAAETLGMVDDYGAKIRKARQGMGMTVEDFARKINEKESVIKKLEQEELTPNNKLVTKVNRALNIQLMERATTTTGPVLSRPIRSRTLGDLVDLKKQDEEG